MKKLIALFAVLALLMCALPALAEGKVDIVQENFHIVGSSSLYGYLYLKLENTGDAPIRIDGGEFEVRDANDNVLASSTTLWRYAEYLKPGESTYAYFSQRLDGIESADDAVTYTRAVTIKETADKETFRLPVESVFEDDVTEGYWTHDYLTTTVVNDTDQTVFDVSIVRVLLDDAGNILYMDSDSMYNYKGITSGSSIVLRRMLNSSFDEYFAAKGYVPATVDAIAYAIVADASAFTRSGADAPAEAVEKIDEPAEQPEEKPVEQPEEQPEEAYATLQKGDKGDAVRQMQERLKALGYLDGKADGDFGKGTARAVTAFQEKAGLPANGIADDATQKALFADDAPAA